MIDVLGRNAFFAPTAKSELSAGLSSRLGAGLVVIEGDAEVVEEGEHLYCQPEALEEVACRLCLTRRADGGARGRRIGCEPSGEQRAVAADERPATSVGSDRRPVSRARRRRLNLPEQRLGKLLGPRLLVLLLQEGQLAQVVDVAADVAAVRKREYGFQPSCTLTPVKCGRCRRGRSPPRRAGVDA